MILRVYVNSVKACHFFWGWGAEGGWVWSFLMISQSKWPIANQKKTLETFVFSATWQPIKLININHNKYPSSCKVLSQNWWWTKLGIEILLKQWHEAKFTQECAWEVVISVSLNICVINCKWAGQNFGWRIDHTMEFILIRYYGNLNNMVFCGLSQRRDQWMGTIGADSHEGMVLSFLSQGQVKQS